MPRFAPSAIGLNFLGRFEVAITTLWATERSVAVARSAKATSTVEPAFRIATAGSVDTFLHIVPIGSEEPGDQGGEYEMKMDMKQ